MSELHDDSGPFIRRGCMVRFSHPDYTSPTTDEIREALRLGGLTGAAGGALLGVGGRTVRKWTGGEQAMPYSAWRLLLIEIGLVKPQRKG